MKGKNLLSIIAFTLLTAGLVVIVLYRVSQAQDQSAVDTLSEQTEVSPSASPTPSDSPFSDKPEVDITSWELKLVNSKTPIDENYKPKTSQLSYGQKVDTRVLDYVQLFLAAAKNEDYSVYITSSYKSYDAQKKAFDSKFNKLLSSAGSQEEAEKQAKKEGLPAGECEDQLGLSFDVSNTSSAADGKFAETELGKWMTEHCTEYGFILRYPQDKEDVTGVTYQPWHFRYVGVAVATYMKAKNLCLEEFLALYDD